MKLMAICAGRKMGNTEILVKEALMAAEELGAEVQMINLSDVSIKPCTGCESCVMMMAQGKKPKCVHDGKDDYESIMREMWDATGVIYAAPTYELSTPGIFKVFANRFLPHDPAFLQQANVIEKIPKRVGGIITAGGSTQSWMTMTLPEMYISMWTHCIKVVDQLMVTGVGRPGHVVLKEDKLAKARKMGQNLVQAMRTPWDEVKWLGEDEGWCPVCHSNLLLQGKPHWDGEFYPIECACCGAGGDIKIEGDKPIFVVNQESLKRNNRLTAYGQTEHLAEIKAHMGEFFGNVEKVQQRIGKYKDYHVPGFKVKQG
ncbi:MAG: flavodoxin family protein [Peptococcaceae bacterium]|nr:flavodoxin family protein [Peptococcaceae bacterium]